jgi:methylated-DNA-protein-cysteine methyltransferase-like protein
MKNKHEHIYAVVKRIPKGRVATYGQIARLAGIPGHARRVGYALSALSDHRRVPWHRVVNAKGGISVRSEPGFEEIQRALLDREGIIFESSGQIDLIRFRWRREPDPERSAPAHSITRP